MHSFGLKMNITELRDYESSDDEIEVDEEIDTASKKVKTKRTPKIWLIDRKFSSAAEAKKYIKDEKEWSFHYKNNTSEGSINKINKIRGKRRFDKILLPY